jgi:hypothetical protein
MQDLADFLGSHPPFDTVGTEDVARVAAVAAGLGGCFQIWDLALYRQG